MRQVNVTLCDWGLHHFRKQSDAYLSLSLFHSFNALCFVNLTHVEITLTFGCRDLSCQLLFSDGVLIGCNKVRSLLSDVFAY